MHFICMKADEVMRERQTHAKVIEPSLKCTSIALFAIFSLICILSALF